MTKPSEHSPRSGLRETIKTIEAAPYFLVCGSCEEVLDGEYKTRWLADEAGDEHVEAVHSDEPRVLVISISNQHVNRSREEFVPLVSEGDAPSQEDP